MINVRNILLTCLLLPVATTLFGQRSVSILPDLETLYLCPNTTFQLDATDAFSYSWSPAAAFDDPGRKDPILQVNSSTMVTLEAVVNGITRRDTLLVEVTEPTLDLVSNQTESVCAGTAVIVTAQNNVDNQGIQWDIPQDLYLIDSLSNRLLIRPLRSTRIIASVQLNGCEARDTILIEVKSPLVTIENADTVYACLGETVKLAATTSSGFVNDLRWSPNINLSDTMAAEVYVSTQPESRTYYATYTEAGCTIVDSVHVRVDSLPDNLGMFTLMEDKNPYCPGDTIIIESPIYDKRFYPLIKHDWTAILTHPEPDEDPQGTWGFETPDTLYNLIVTAQDSADYIRVTTSGGCVDTSQLLIPVIPPKEITITPDPATICPGETISLTAAFDGPGEITWEPEDYINGRNDQKTVNIGPLAEATEVTITVEEEECPSSQSITVEVPPALIGLNSETIICAGESIRLNFTRLEGVDYQWTSPDLPNFTSTDPTLSVSPTTTTTYELMAQGGTCPAETASITVNVIQAAQVNVTPSSLTICPNEEFTLTASGNATAGAVESYEWSFGGSSQAGDELTIRTLSQNATFLMTYIVSKPGGQECFRDTEQSVITVEPQPEITGFAFNPDSATSTGIYLGESVGVLAFIEGNTEGYLFEWMANDNLIDGMNSNITDSPGEDTDYQLTLTSPNGCMTTATSPLVRVIVPQYDIPNVFTPNGDNVNDYFNLAYTGIRDLQAFIQEFKVFNRWGQIVYNNDTPETGWDGTYKGNVAPPDVYIYKITVQFPDGKIEENSGEVTLIR